MMVQANDMKKISLPEIKEIISTNHSESKIVSELTEIGLSEEFINLVISEYHHLIGIETIFVQK